MEYITLDEQVWAEAKNEGKLEGIAEGKKEGLAQGRKEGILEHAQETYNRLIKDGFSPELAHKYAYGS